MGNSNGEWSTTGLPEPGQQRCTGSNRRLRVGRELANQGLRYYWCWWLPANGYSYRDTCCHQHNCAYQYRYSHPHTSTHTNTITDSSSYSHHHTSTGKPDCYLNTVHHLVY